MSPLAASQKLQSLGQRPEEKVYGKSNRRMTTMTARRHTQRRNWRQRVLDLRPVREEDYREDADAVKAYYAAWMDEADDEYQRRWGYRWNESARPGGIAGGAR